MRDRLHALPLGFQKQTTVGFSVINNLMGNITLKNSGERYYQNVTGLISTADADFGMESISTGF